MFDESWGVDVAVSTPRLMTALVEEAVSVGDLVRIFQFQQAQASMVELTLPGGQPLRRRASATSTGPADTVLVGIIRDDRRSRRAATTPSRPHDELLFITTPEHEDELEEMLVPRRPHPPRRED